MEPLNIGTVLPLQLESEMRSSYMDYAMSVIVSRALPDVRDGLKPGQRRILHNMNEQGMTAGARFQKCAAIVGDVLKLYHPHGDAAVYDTLVRMAQDFSLRYPLVDGQGNFGSIDGDAAAAYRYTEARMTGIAAELLADIEKDTVDWADNYSATRQEPTVLPARIPNLLINGSTGIAVGMTTNIPPHNLVEVCDGEIYLIDHPDATTEDLMKIVRGPDFPTGGIIIGREGIASAYGTGHGRLIVRARVTFEEASNGRERIIVHEIPYMVNKATLVGRIAELVGERRLEGIADLNDESDRHGMRIVIELKKDARPLTVLNNLYKHTALQTTFGVISLALVDGRPVVLNLKALLQHHIDHRRIVITRRTRFDLERARERAHILEGLKIALDNLDAIIKTIRESQDEKQAQDRLQERFKLSERQSKAIIDMRLGRLTRLERGKVEEEYAEIIKRIAYLEDLLQNAAKIDSLIKEELAEIKKKYGDPRRTQLDFQGSVELNEEDLVPKEDVVVTLTHRGYVKRVPATTYRPQRRGGKGVLGAARVESDFVEHLVISSTHSDMLFFTNHGSVFRLRVHEIPDVSRQAKGLPIANLIDIDPKDKITAVIGITDWAEDRYLVMVTKQGTIKKTPARLYSQVRRNGLIAINLAEGDELNWVKLSSGSDELIIATTDGKAIRFNEKQVRPMGRDTQGVRGISLREKALVAGFDIARKGAHLLVVSAHGYGKLTPVEEYPAHGRGGQGVYTMAVTDRTGPLVGMRIVVNQKDEQLIVISEGGQVIRTPIENIRISGRQTQGVIIMRLEEGDTVATIAGVGGTEEEEEA
ncbi:MAG TPA: DNA gyrase subunit A [Candidatus Limnocylindrales bacterium]|nr:DNA gyrase subunit A [Candidatus Limnocylindrales bacterium]